MVPPLFMWRESVGCVALFCHVLHIISMCWTRVWLHLLIAGASKTNESLCQNNMHILKLLSEEVFDFSSGQMTQTKVMFSVKGSVTF
jgi:hypothetical protein